MSCNFSITSTMNDYEEFPSDHYKNVLKNLLKDLETASTLSEIRNLFLYFQKKYTMVPKLWLKWFELEEKSHYSDFDILKMKSQKNVIKNLAQHHFDFNDYNIIDEYSWKDGSFKKTIFIDNKFLEEMKGISIQQPTTSKPLEAALRFPHNYLKGTMFVCQMLGSKLFPMQPRPIPTKTLKFFGVSKKLFARNAKNRYDCLCISGIKTLEDYAKIKCQKFFFNTTERRLAQHPHCQDAWKLLIKFLKNNADKYPLMILCLYSRYCRLFIEDFEMRQNYIKDIERIGASLQNDISKWWIDCIEILRIFESKKAAENLIDERYLNNIKSEALSDYLLWFQNVPSDSELIYALQRPQIINTLTLPMMEKEYKTSVFVFPTKGSSNYYSFSNVSDQSFVLPAPLVRYIYKNSNFITLQKLYQSSKYFFEKMKIPLCHRLAIYDSNNRKPTYFEQSLFIDPTNLNLKCLNGIVVTNALQIYCKDAKHVISILLTKVSHIRVFHLILTKQILSLQEMNSLNCDQIETVGLFYVEIKKDFDTFLTVEETIDMFPKAYRLAMNSNYFTQETTQKLAKTKRFKKYGWFHISPVPATFNTEHFMKYLNKYAEKKAIVSVGFNRHVDIQQKDKFRQEAQKLIGNTNAVLTVI